ncbi:MAG TPA: SPFH domain-containing protein [Candidatus Xenobia bacterium]
MRYVLLYRNGTVRAKGPGLSFYYLPQRSSVAQVPLQSKDLPFIFNETSSDFQPVTVQGQLTWQIVAPEDIASRLDFTVNPSGTYLGDGPQVLDQRLLALTQVIVRAVVGGVEMRVAIASAAVMGREIHRRLQASETIQKLGIEVLEVSVMQVRTSPEMTRALEAPSREGLQREADQAVYDRRNASVEQERRIKQNEFTTELGVEQGQRTLQETRMAARIAVEQQRTQLIDERVENDRKQADSRAYTLEATLRPLRDADWKVLMAASGSAADPRANLALAFRELAENAGKIGQLTITPDLLGSLVNGARK